MTEAGRPKSSKHSKTAKGIAKSKPLSGPNAKVVGARRKANVQGKPGVEVGVHDKPRETIGSRGGTGTAAEAKQAAFIKAHADDGEGTERLRKAAAAAVSQKWAELSRVLLEKAEAGHLGRFKLLITLAERIKPREKPVKKRRGPTQAQRLALEPAWKGEMPEDSRVLD